MFYSRFLESVERWPDVIAVEIKRQPGSEVPRLYPSSVTTAADGHVIESYTLSQLRQMAERVGAWLQRSGFSAGTRCAVLAANSPRWVAAYLGVVASGNTAVPLDTAFHPDQVAKLLDDCGARLLFVDERNLAHAREAVAGRDVALVLLDAHIDGMPSFDDIFRNTSADGFAHVVTGPDDVACILYTSGTTSDPKGVMLTQNNLRGEMEAVFSLFDLGPTDAILGVLPLFHALAQMANLLLALASGMRVVYLDSLNTTELMTALRDRGITIFCCVPQFYYLIHERVFSEVKKRGPMAQRAFSVLMLLSRAAHKFHINLGKVFFGKIHQMLGPKVRFFVTGGSRFDAAIGHDFQALGFEILQAYGLTECTGGGFITRLGDNVMGSIGKPLPTVEAKLLDPKVGVDTSGQAVGEIAIRGQIIMKGYYNRPDATDAVLKDGWLHTGDLAYVDHAGHYFITGRAKEVIVLSSGKNIYPEEIEGYYQKSPWIKDICVMGLESRPGEPFSERLHAVIVPNFDLLRQKKIVNTREVIRYDIENISTHLPATKRILSYDIWQEDLPRTTTRKLRRFEIERHVRELMSRAQVEQQGDAIPARPLTEADQQWLAESDVQRALSLVRKASKRQGGDIHPDDNLELDLGLDSMERVELLVELEHNLDADVDDTAAAEVYTVRELIDLVRTHAGRGVANGAGWENLLAGEMTDPEVLALSQRRSLAIRIVFRFWFIFGKLVTIFASDAFHLKVEGLENVPLEGPFILSPNHQSFLDAPILTALMPWSVFHRLFYVGTSEIFGEGLMRRFARFLRLIPVDPDANLVPAMRAGAYGLRHDQILVLYPEGERSIDGTPRVFKKGAAILARHLNVPIVPVAHDGFYDAWPRNHKFQKFAPLKIRIGKPIYPDPNEPPEVAYDRLTRELRNRVVEMWEEMHSAHAAPEGPPLRH